MKIINPKDLIIHHSLPPVAKKGDKVSIDTEFFQMNGKRLHRPHGISAAMGCSFDGQTVYMITDESDIPEFMRRIDAGLHIYQNAKFDLGQIRRYTDYPDRKLLWDTMIMEQIMFAGWYAPNEFSLADLARRWLDVYMSKTVRSEFETATELTKEQLEYAAVDIAVTWRVYEKQRQHADEDDLNVWKHIDRPALYSVLKMKGMKLDTEAWAKLYEENTAEAKRIADKYPEINLGSWQQVLKELKRLGYKDQSKTNEKSLIPLVGECEFAADVLEYRGRSKAAGTYGLKWMDEHLESDGRIYSDFYINGAACLPKGELVLTSSGYIPVEKARVGDFVVSHTGKPKKIIDAFPNKASDVLRVSLENGMEIRCSDNHPFLVYRASNDKYEWVEARYLLDSDWVVVQESLIGKERWKRIDGWEDFSVSTWGRVVNNKTGRILKQYPKGKWGHLKVQLYRNKEQKRGDDRKDFPVHRLVLQAFYGNSDMEVRHLNGIAWDNSIGNLKYGTTKENRTDSLIHGTSLKRWTKECKVEEKDVSYIRNNNYKKGDDTRIAKELGISREHVRDIRTGKRWKSYDVKEKKVDFILEKLASVVWDSKEMVYGLTVEDDHSHVTAGIVTHNTGRFSSSKPNVENIPQKDGPQFRKCFVADTGNVLIDADFSTQEPRIWAYLAQDSDMIDVFKNKKDIYLYFAKQGFGWDMEKSDPRRKTRMKPTVLGAIFGLTKFGLLEKDQIPLDEGEELLDAFWDKAFPISREYRDRIRKTKDYVTTVYGRKYWLNPYQFGHENNCLNSPVQGTAADIVKIAGARFQAEIEKQGYSECVWIINYIHDEILVECGVECQDWVMETLRRVMLETAESTHDGVPADIEIACGHTWADCH